MKQNFHNDVNNDNLEIADMILDDSKKINTDNAFNENLFTDIKNNNIHSQKRFHGKKAYALASTVAACLIMVVSVTYWGINHARQKNSFNKGTHEIFLETQNTDSELSVASDYTEIYQRMRTAGIVSLSWATAEKDSVVSFNSFSGVKKSDSTTASSAKNDAADIATENSSSTNYYDTNEQTENVQEGDIVKTDGNYIYTLTYNEKKDCPAIIITKAYGMNLENISKINIKDKNKYDQNISEIYVFENKLIAIGTRYNEASVDASNDALVDRAYPEEGETVIYVYDISDKKHPNLISENTQDGIYHSSRMSDGFLYTISNKTMNAMTKDTCVPEVNGNLMSAQCVYLPAIIDRQAYTIITTLDLKQPEDFSNSAAVAGSVSTIYASQDNLYLISNDTKDIDISKTNLGKKALEKTNLKFYEHKKTTVDKYVKEYIKEYYDDINVKEVVAYKDTAVYKAKDQIQIIKYSYDKDKVTFVADTTVDGSSYDNLNFDEKDGYLRLVTTEGADTNVETRINYYDKNGKFLFYTIDTTDSIASAKKTNNVFVLDKDLKKKAEINNLAKGEEIYSSRFLGDYGYFVTYENTDPLFSVDFSDIENPNIIGKLKLPGFSDYLHFYTGNKLFGFGVETNDDGLQTGLKMEMYNVEDGNASQESKLVLEDYDDSPALENYKAFMIDSDKGFIGFTAENYTSDEYDQTSYLLYTYENNKFKKLIEIQLKNCYESRSFYINDYLYIVDPDNGIRVLNLKTYTKDKKVAYEKF